MMRLGFGLESPSKDSLTQFPKRALTGTSPTSHSDGDFSYRMLAPVGPNEVDFFLESPQGYKPRESVRSGRKQVGCFSFDVLVFPAGNQASHTSSPKMAVYVEAVGVEGNGSMRRLCLISLKGL
jgi:hypothetical protein